MRMSIFYLISLTFFSTGRLKVSEGRIRGALIEAGPFLNERADPDKVSADPAERRLLMGDIVQSSNPSLDARGVEMYLSLSSAI